MHDLIAVFDVGKTNTKLSLIGRRNWSRLFPPRRAASDLLGSLAAQIVAATGLPKTCQIACGVHDSNASWLWHLRKVTAGSDLTVISSGTWTIAMKNRADLGRLDETRGMLTNVDVFGTPAPTAFPIPPSAPWRSKVWQLTGWPGEHTVIASNCQLQSKMVKYDQIFYLPCASEVMP